jgi:hypothetical protein
MTELDSAPQGDSIRDSLMAAFESPAPDTMSAPIPELDAPASDDAPQIDTPSDGRARDPATGKFIPKTEDAAPNQAAAPAKTPDQGQTAKPEPAPQAIQPPQSWSAPAKAVFASLPPEVQQEVLKRERDYSTGIEAKSLEAKRYEPLEQIIGPRREAWTRQFGSPEKGLQTLIGISENASRDPEGFVRWFAQNSGLDLAKLAEAQANQPPQDPRVAALERQVSQLNGFLTSQQQAQQQQQLNSLSSVVEAFRADPANEHFDSVAQDVLDAIPVVRKGMPHATPQEVLKEAYERTIWASPGIRTQLLAKQTADAAAQKQKEAQAQADKSRAAASVSLTGAPPSGAAPPAGAPAATLRDELERQFSSRV